MGSDKTRTMRVLAFGALLAGALVWFSCARMTPREGWSDAWGPMVPHESFPGDCGICHTSESWSVLRPNFEFDHAEVTGYALEGAHQRAACLRCHNDRGPVESYVARGCGGCHVDPHRSTLGIECTECHNQDTWRPIGLIEEHALTRFPLIGAHALTPCETCHITSTIGDYKNAPVECHLCHQRTLNFATPPHVPSGWNVNCERCHDPSTWSNVRFEHDFFPLIGGHAGLNCVQCHSTGIIGPLDPDCFQCHQQDYLAAPNHVAQNFSTNCVDCHNIFDWNDVP